MVTTVNGNRGSSVVPIEEDDYLFLGRGRHVIIGNGDVRMNGSSGYTLTQGIEASRSSKMNQMQSVANTMKAMLMIPIGGNDYLMTCDSGYIIE